MFKNLCVCVFLFSSLAFAQESEKGVRGFFGGGWMSVNAKALNTTLQASGYPAMNKSLYSIGGGGYGIYQRFIIGAEGYGLIGTGSQNDMYYTKATGGYGFFNLGYIALKAGKLDIYPFIGLGFGGMNYNIKSIGDMIFSNVMGNPNRGISMVKGYLLAMIALGMDYMIMTGEKSGIILDLRLGYLFSIKESGWSYGDNIITGGPKFPMQGFFLRLALGFGSDY